MRPYVAKSYFETYKSYDHMQKIGPLSQNFNEILTFENLETMRFCHTKIAVTHSIFEKFVINQQFFKPVMPFMQQPFDTRIPTFCNSAR